VIGAVRKALEQHLASLSPTWPTAWENVAYQPSGATSFQRVFLMPAAPVSEGVFRGSVVRHVGIFQVDVITPMDGGPGDSDARAEAIQSHFKRGTSLAVAGAQNLWVSDHPTINPATFDATWRVLPVTIVWNIFEEV
jgi:hypothetical protein